MEFCHHFDWSSNQGQLKRVNSIITTSLFPFFFPFLSIFLSSEVLHFLFSFFSLPSIFLSFFSSYFLSSLLHPLLLPPSLFFRQPIFLPYKITGLGHINLCKASNNQLPYIQPESFIFISISCIFTITPSIPLQPMLWHMAFMSRSSYTDGVMVKIVVRKCRGSVRWKVKVRILDSAEYGSVSGEDNPSNRRKRLWFISQFNMSVTSYGYGVISLSASPEDEEIGALFPATFNWF